MTSQKPSLDEDSARRIARAQIAQAHANAEGQFNQFQYPQVSKRGAWLRQAELGVRQFYGEFLLAVIVGKRSVTSIAISPANDLGNGWLSIFSYTARHRGGNLAPISVGGISEHAIAKLMVRLREVNALKAIQEEFLGWSAACLLDCADRKPAYPQIFVPSKTGYFMSSLDESVLIGDRELLVLKTWIADRTLTRQEQLVLADLRRAQRVGVGLKLKECVSFGPEESL